MDDKPPKKGAWSGPSHISRMAEARIIMYAVSIVSLSMSNYPPYNLFLNFGAQSVMSLEWVRSLVHLVDLE